jgi:hypothetical protein
MRPVKKVGEDAPLLVAARQLQEALSGYERIAHDLLRGELDSRRSVERAAQALAGIAQADEELRQRVGELVGAITGVRDRQQLDAESVQQRALLVVERKRALDALLTRMAKLGESVKAVTALFDAARRAPGEDLGDAEKRVGELADLAQGFALEAQTQGFPDLVADGQALRQQLLSIKSKLGLVKDRVPRA